jgi:sortase A
MPKPRARRIFRLLFLLVGIVCLGIYSYSYLYRTAYQFYEGWKFDHEAAYAEPAPADAPIRSTSKTPKAMPTLLPDPDKAVPALWSSVPVSVLGRISIPRLNISAIVEEGVDDNTLARAIGHIPGTALPGEQGNIGIAGHRDTFFRALRDLQPHDIIDFATHTGRFHFTVDSLTVVDPSDVRVLKSTGDHSLTIVTCFPFQYIGNAPRRFIVHAISQ